MINLLLIFVLITLITLVVVTFQSFKTFQFVSLDFFINHTPVLFLYILPYSLIISIVFAATLTYARLSADNEIDVMRLTGLGLFRIISPAVLTGLICSFIHFYSVSEIAPQVMARKKSMERDLAAMTLSQLPPGKQAFVLADGRYKLSYTNYQNGVLEKPILIIFDRIQNQVYEKERYIATKATISRNKDYMHSVQLTDCTLRKFIRDPENPAIVKKMEEARLDQTSPVTLDLEASSELRRPKYLSTEELGLLIRFSQEGHIKREALMEYHKRYSSIFYCFLLALAGTSVGILTRRASKLAGLGVSLPLLIVYFVMTLLFEGLGISGKVNPIIAAYFPCSIFVTISLLLLRLVR